MGLDIRLANGLGIGRAGSYSGFHAFRVWLAEQVGVNLDAMQGFEFTFKGELKVAPEEVKAWTGYEPLYEFLNHSDSDGDITVEQCEKLLPQMREVRNKLLGKEKAVQDESHFVERLEWWINAMEVAIEKNSPVEFV